MDLGAVLSSVSIGLSVIAVVLLVVVLVALGRHRGALDALRRDSDELRRGRAAADDAAPDGSGIGAGGPAGGFRHVAVVMNPSKHDDPEAFRERLRLIAERVGGVQLAFHDTTREDAGYGQALTALRDDADLVIAAGGDGTVRMVAAALAHSGVRMGILPVGTGNLMARNLEIPLDLEKALLTALEGEDRGVDIGWMRTGTSKAYTERADPQPFLVIAGVGADAEIIGATDPTMKKRIGWPAYVIPGLSRIVGRSFAARVQMVPGRTQDLDVRTVLIGNVGKLPAGIVLMPDADASNGKLEILALSWRGAAGLSQIGAKLVNPHAPTYPQLATMEKGMVTEVRVTTHKPQPVQLDGDTEDRATHIIARVDAGALLMRVPDGASR
ncbi:diacylglycerol/lipid kinase family protein [Brachybacterium sp. DNPG3]